MGHSATKIQMGSTGSSFKEVSSHKGVVAAGLCVNLKSDDTITTASADGASLGISVGRDMSQISHTSICRKGLKVPILLTNGFTPTLGAQVAISNTTGKAIAYTGSGNRYVNASYASAALSAVDEDGVAIADGAAYIDFPGGL